MLLFSNLISADKKLLAYNFVNDSGLQNTAEKTGHTNSSVFSFDLFSGTGAVIYSLLSLLGIVFLGLTIYGGIQWMTAEGDESKVEKAHKTITQAVIGLVIVLAAYAISIFIINTITPKTLKTGLEKNNQITIEQKINWNNVG
jgi:TRAP-type C4-dicarboxylate transport system permease small subunit